MTTIATISANAFNAASVAITDVIYDAVLTYVTQADFGYDPNSGQYMKTETSINGRCLFDTTTPAQDIFGDFTQGPREEMVLLEGFSAECREGWKLTVGGSDYTVQRAQTIAGSVSLQYAVVLKL